MLRNFHIVLFFLSLACQFYLNCTNPKYSRLYLKCKESPSTLNFHKWPASFRVSPRQVRSALCADSCLLHAYGSS